MEWATFSSSSTSRWKYDLFLSFRGADIRTSFISHLFRALDVNGIKVFKDDRSLERGEPIASNLLKAIQESRFSIVVFSRTYAFSRWCLDELDHIVACMNSGSGHKVFPVFLDVEPSDVRKQSGPFGKAFVKHEKCIMEDNQRISKWRSALTEIASLYGWHIENSEEAYVIQEIVKEISVKINAARVVVTRCLPGIKERLEVLKRNMCLGSKDVRFIGIWGMGGIGKTELATLAYDHASEWDHFDGKSFLADVRKTFERKKCVLSLQKQLLSEILMEQYLYMLPLDDQDGAKLIKEKLCRKKVFVVIDDVDNIDQLTFLARDHDWFGPGSRIIITSRDLHMSKARGIYMDSIYRLTPLNYEESGQLLNFYAFKSYEAPKQFDKFSDHVVRYCEGLPLALKVLGSFLYGRDINEWKSTINRLKMDIEDKIFYALRLSFDGLQKSEQDIFLDIACFFRGKKISYVIHILNGCEFEPSIVISVLIEKGFLTIQNGKLRMHDLLQDMGRKIVEYESLDEPGKRSRLWKEDDIRSVLTKNTGTEAIEGLMCEETMTKEIRVDTMAFSKMKKLRLLKVDKLVFSRHELTYLPSTLRLLDLGYAFKYIPSIFQPDELVEINIKGNQIVSVFHPPSFGPWKSLTELKLSRNNFEGLPEWIRQVVPSISELDLTDCERLRLTPKLPSGVESISAGGSVSLETLPDGLPNQLNLENCYKLKLDQGCNSIHNSRERKVSIFSFQGSKCSAPAHTTQNCYATRPTSSEEISESISSSKMLKNYSDSNPTPLMDYRDMVQGVNVASHQELLDLKESSSMEEVTDLLEEEIDAENGIHISVVFTQEERNSLRAPWTNAIIARIIGKSVENMQLKLHQIWSLKNDLEIIDLGKDYFVARFSSIEDLDMVLKGGPWFMDNRFLTIRRWEPNFNASMARFDSVALWIRLPELPIEYISISALSKIGSVFGRPLLRVDDDHIIDGHRKKFARLCIQFNVEQPLPKFILVDEIKQPIIYEGIGMLCFNCGHLGHRKNSCPQNSGSSNNG